MGTVPERLLDTCLPGRDNVKVSSAHSVEHFDRLTPLGHRRGYNATRFASYSRIGLQDIIGSDTVPSVGKPTTEYAGFLDEPVHRPLLATSGAKELVASHADWGKGVPSESDANRLWPQFERLIPVIDDCRVDSHSEPIPSDGRPLRREDLAIAAAWVDRPDFDSC
jgi:hypothetical protein